jgi:hypothetical protein
MWPTEPEREVSGVKDEISPTVSFHRGALLCCSRGYATEVVYDDRHTSAHTYRLCTIYTAETLPVQSYARANNPSPCRSSSPIDTHYWMSSSIHDGNRPCRSTPTATQFVKVSNITSGSPLLDLFLTNAGGEKMAQVGPRECGQMRICLSNDVCADGLHHRHCFRGYASGARIVACNISLSSDVKLVVRQEQGTCLS